MKHYKYTRELLEPLVQASTSIRQVIQKLGLNDTGGNHCHLKRVIDDLKISRTHFLGQGHNKGKKKPKITKEIFISEYLIKDKRQKSHECKLRLYKFGLKKEQCEECNQQPIWNNKKLGMHLDHINGDHQDYRYENLKILCPNCHTQTPTYSSKKR